MKIRLFFIIFNFCILFIISSNEFDINSNIKGKLKVSSYNEVVDENGNKINFYNKSPGFKTINPSFIKLFTKKNKNIILITKYIEKINSANIMLPIGIISSGLSAFMLIEIPILFVLSHFEIVSYLFFQIVTGILSGSGLQFLVVGIITFILYFVFNNNAKLILQEMVGGYNYDLLDKNSLNQMNKNKIDLCFSFKIKGTSK